MADFKEVCNDTIVFYPSNNEWKTAEKLQKARALFGCAVLNSMIYVLGGKGENESDVDSVEIFNAYQECWTFGGYIKLDPMSACSVFFFFFFILK